MMTRRLLTPVAVTAAAMGAFLATTPQALALPYAGEGASGKVFTGRAASYTPGLGACGWFNDETDDVVALNAAQFGHQSNGSKACGKTVTITHRGSTISAIVTDKCMRCGVHGLDLSPVVFRNLTGHSTGKINIKWSFS
jgi:expansin (peptidoglycan-binding protein)